MCGRFIWINIEKSFLKFKVTAGPEDSPMFTESASPSLSQRWNIAPGQEVAVIRDESRVRKAEWMTWGMRPYWAKDGQKLPININARDDQLNNRMWYRSVRKYRCAIPTDGFYEWKKLKGRKQPYLFTMKSKEPFVFAGIYDTWYNHNTRKMVRSFAIITTYPNSLMEPIHNRMPVILDNDGLSLWLNSSITDSEILAKIARSYSNEEMHAYTVSTAVNNWRNEGPELLEKRTFI